MKIKLNLLITLFVILLLIILGDFGYKFYTDYQKSKNPELTQTEIVYEFPIGENNTLKQIEVNFDSKSLNLIAEKSFINNSKYYQFDLNINDLGWQKSEYDSTTKKLITLSYYSAVLSSSALKATNVEFPEKITKIEYRIFEIDKTTINSNSDFTPKQPIILSDYITSTPIEIPQFKNIQVNTTIKNNLEIKVLNESLNTLTPAEQKAMEQEKKKLEENQKSLHKLEEQKSVITDITVYEKRKLELEKEIQDSKKLLGLNNET